MNSIEVEQGLKELILTVYDYDGEDMETSEFVERVSEVATFEERMVLTHDHFPSSIILL